MNPLPYQAELDLAIAALTQSAHYCETIRRNRQHLTLQKSDHSPVTIADLGAQALICRAIAQAFPQDPIVAEENADLLRQPEQSAQLGEIVAHLQALVGDATASAVLDWIDRGRGGVGDRFWTLDPIDGTKGFLRDDQYAIALALIEAGQVQLGVLACPRLPVDPEQPQGERGVLFWAVRGQSAWQRAIASTPAHPIQVSTAVAGPSFRAVESVETGHGNRPLQRQIAQAVGLTQPPLPMDSLAKYGAIARGQAVLYLRLPWVERPGYQENIWDHAAGAILVEAAGGSVTDMTGRPLNFAAAPKLIHNSGIVVSNGALHPELLQAIAQFTT